MESTLAEWAVGVLREQGLLGLVCAFQGFAIYRLFNRNQELHDTIRSIASDNVAANVTTANSINRLADLLLHRNRGE